MPMPTLDVKMIRQKQTVGEITLSLNALNVPRVSEILIIDKVHYQVKAVQYEVQTEQTTGEYCINRIRLTVDSEEET